jgi:integrase
MAEKPIKLKHGVIFQKGGKGTYYYRYHVNGRRKVVSLKSKNRGEAQKKAEEIMPLITASSLDVVAAHVSYVKFGQQERTLRLSEAWSIYEKHPNKATPATISERQSYQATWRDFVGFVKDDLRLEEITIGHAVQYADYLRTQEIAVDTHNRKIRRLKKVFDTCKAHYSGENPFVSPGLRRKDREEQGTSIRRLSFSKEQEQQLLDVLNDDTFKVINKQEVRTIYNLGIFTGQRMKDCALLQWDKVNFNRNRIWVKQFKTCSEVSIPISTELLKALREAELWKENNYVLPRIAERYQISDENGKNIGADLVTRDLLRVIRWIGLEPSIKVAGRIRKVTVYGFHSLRHSFASHCAEAGVPKAVAQSILGAASDIIDKYYVHIGEEAQQQALEAISLGSDTQLSAQNRLDQAQDYLVSLGTLTPELKKLQEILAES